MFEVDTNNVESLKEIISMLLENTKIKLDLAAPCQTLVEHTTNMLKAFKSNSKHLIPNSHIIDDELWVKLMQITIIFHDIGKLNLFFQLFIISKRKDYDEIKGEFKTIIQAKDSYEHLLDVRFNKKYRRHTIESAILAYYFLTEICNKLFKDKNIIRVFMNAILTHHSGHMKLPEKMSDLRFYLTRLRSGNQKELWSLFYTFLKKSSYLMDIANIITDIELKNLFEEFHERIENDSSLESYFLRNGIKEIIRDMFFDGTCISQSNNSSFIHLVQYTSSVLYDLDEWDAITNRNTNLDSMEISFDITRKETNQRLIDDYIKENTNDSPLNPIRESFLKNTRAQFSTIKIEEKRIFRMIAPTGAGKTLNLLSAAFSLKEQVHSNYGFYPKIIYALPFISICDQIEMILSELLETTSQTSELTVHHYLSNFQKDRSNDMEDEYDFLSPYEIRLWRSDFIVTTTIKLFYTILHFYKNKVKRFHRLCNSIIIIDEYHSLPIKYQNLVKKVIENLTRNFNVYFIIATATAPAIFENTECKDLVDNKLFMELNRYWINYIKEPKTPSEFFDYVSNQIKMHQNENIMIVVNTRNLARNLFLHLQGLSSDETIDSDNLLHLSGNMLPNHRKRTISEEILPRLKNRKNTILVTTQLIEAGIDIDFDYIIRELSPFSSIVQTAGRCNRHNKKNEDEIPEISLVKVKDVPNPYDPIDLGVTIETLDNLKGLCSSTKLTENFIRKNYQVYTNALNKRRAKSDLLVEYKDCEYEELSDRFKLINDSNRYPLVIIPKEQGADEVVSAIQKVKDKRYISKVIWVNSISISKSQLVDRFRKNLEMIEDKDIVLYILDLRKNEDFYRNDIGLYIET